MALTRKSSTESEMGSGLRKRQKLNIDPRSSASEVTDPTDTKMDSFEPMFNIQFDDDDNGDQISSPNYGDPIDPFWNPDMPRELLFDTLEHQTHNSSKGDLQLVKGQSAKYARQCDIHRSLQIFKRIMMRLNSELLELTPMEICM
jgi:hypothetical protein